MIIGALAGSRPADGRAVRTGQCWRIVISSSLPSAAAYFAIGSSSEYSPSPAIHSRRPAAQGGARIDCGGAAITVPMGWPGARATPGSSDGLKWKRPGAVVAMPGLTLKSSVPVRRRSNPSKMPPSRPGPSGTESERPVPETSSPGSSPVVSS